MKSILTFQKWTKINVQKSNIQNTLTDENFCLHKEKLWSHFKPENLFLLR